MTKLAELRDERKEAARKAAQEKKKAKKQAEAMEAQAALTDGKPPQTRPHNKEAKKKGEGMAKQKAQAACETPQKRPQKQGGSVAKKPRRKDNLSSPSCLQSQSVALPQLLLGGWGAASAA